MAWERRSGHLYFYSATRRGGRVVKTYHGRGDLGELAAGVVAGAKRRRAERAAALAAEEARLGPAMAAMAALDGACRLVVEATLTVNGYHQHKYAWRRRRVRIEERGLAPAAGRGRDSSPDGEGPGR